MVGPVVAGGTYSSGEAALGAAEAGACEAVALARGLVSGLGRAESSLESLLGLGDADGDGDEDADGDGVGASVVGAWLGEETSMAGPRS